jgi:hypothetical protein
MEQSILESSGNTQQARRPYETPKVTDLGKVAQLTQDPQVAPYVSNNVGTEVFFLGDNA